MLSDDLFVFVEEDDLIFVKTPETDVTVTIDGTVEDDSLIIYVDEEDLIFYDDNDEELDVIIEDEVIASDVSILIPGEQGPPGEDGEDGAPGLSAYEIAVRDGFVGTELEWVESLRGEAGQDADYAKTEFRQNTLSSQWVITHNYPYRPEVIILDTNGDEVFADISYPTTSTIVIKFAYETTGMVQLG